MAYLKLALELWERSERSVLLGDFSAIFLKLFCLMPLGLLLLAFVSKRMCSLW